MGTIGGQYWEYDQQAVAFEDTTGLWERGETTEAGWSDFRQHVAHSGETNRSCK